MNPIVVKLSGDVDLACRDATMRVLAEAVATANADSVDVVVDLSGVTFLDSTGISCLVGASRELGTAQSLYLTDPSPMTRRVLEVVGLTMLIREDLLIDSPEAD